MSNYETYQMINGAPNSPYYTNTSAALDAGIWAGVALILAIIGGILVYFLFIKNKTAPKGKFAKWLKDFLNFKIMWLEPILKVVYYIATIFTILFSFSFLSQGGAGLIAFLLSLTLGPVLIRIVYEAAIMFVMIWRNTKDIAENTSKKK